MAREMTESILVGQVDWVDEVTRCITRAPAGSWTWGPVTS